MPARKTSPPEEKPARKTTAKKPAAKKATAKKATTKTMDAKVVLRKTTKPENDNPPAGQPKKELNRKPSPRNGNVLPEGRPFTAGEQACENGRRGGIKSAETKAKRKTLCEELITLLMVTSKDSEGKDHTMQEQISAAMIKQARSGNVRAFESIRDTIGEKQQERIEMAVALPQFESLDEAFAKLSGDGR